MRELWGTVLVREPQVDECPMAPDKSYELQRNPAKPRQRSATWCKTSQFCVPKRVDLFFFSLLFFSGTKPKEFRPFLRLVVFFSCVEGTEGLQMGKNRASRPPSHGKSWIGFFQVGTPTIIHPPPGAISWFGASASAGTRSRLKRTGADSWEDGCPQAGEASGDQMGCFVTPKK